MRLWTSLVDLKKHPAQELLTLYSQRWGREIFHQELKLDMCSSPRRRNHTPLTAVQELGAMILGYLGLVDYRVEAAVESGVQVLRINFIKTLRVVQGLWQFFDVSSGILSRNQINLMINRSMRLIVDSAIPKRGNRSCHRKLRQPVSGWVRLRKNTYRKGPVDFFINAMIPQIT